MKHILNTVRPPRTKSYLKHKLVSATAMLLVSSILMVSTSYAWYVLSTAPEVTNIKTQVGANGALEIALLNQQSWGNLDLLDMGDIDESATEDDPVAATVANLTWGNLIDLDDNSYGLDRITLNPSRLYIEQDGSSGSYKVNSTPLKTPIYGEDGRVKGLDKTGAVAYTFDNGTFSNANGYGVRAIGTSATMSVFQLGMNAARSTLVTYSSAARTAASNSLQDTGGALANIVVAYAVSDKSTGFTNTDVDNIKALAEGLEDSLNAIESALRQVFAGYITTAKAAEDGITSENYQEKLAEITNEGGGKKTLSELLTMYPGITAVVPNIGTHITKFNDDRTQVANAITKCGTLTDNDHTWSELADIILPLVDTTAMQVNGRTITQLKAELMPNGTIDFNAAFAVIQDGLSITVPTGSGILSDIADFAGDYKATVSVQVDSADFGMSLGVVSANVAMVTVGANPTHLTESGNGLKAATVADAQGSNSITDYYGYAIDLAFRTNAEESDLLLQTEPENRIYEGDERNAALQGAGSYMSFTTTAGLSATKMVKLMSGIRVVLMDGTQNILAIAALDTTLGKDVYAPEMESGAATGRYYLDGSAGAYQNSDLIDTTAYNALEDVSHVKFNKTTGKITAKLYLYNYEMTRSSTSTAEAIKYTGGLTLGGKIESGVITALTPDVPQRVTALVYLDGSFVNNSMVAANSAQSMAGTLNLQFSSSATLVPAEITKLQTEGSAVEYTVMEGEPYESGYLYYGGYLGKVKDGYTFYEGSDDKIYFATEGSEYTELTAETAATALTVVTATLTADKTSIAVGGTTTLSVTLNVTDEDLVGPYGFIRTSNGDEAATTVGDAINQTTTVTGLIAGSDNYYGEITVLIGSQSFLIKSNTVTVTVTAAS